jgi:hypothetical protein
MNREECGSQLIPSHAKSCIAHSFFSSFKTDCGLSFQFPQVTSVKRENVDGVDYEFQIVATVRR